jgi:hypothetical protein
LWLGGGATQPLLVARGNVPRKKEFELEGTAIENNILEEAS